MATNKNNEFLKLNFLKKNEKTPSQIRIDMDGTVYIDGELYDEENSKYKNLTIDIGKHNKLNTGEETQKIIESSKTAKKGEVVTIKDIKTPDRMESTTVKF